MTAKTEVVKNAEIGEAKAMIIVAATIAGIGNSSSNSNINQIYNNKKLSL